MYLPVNAGINGAPGYHSQAKSSQNLCTSLVGAEETVTDTVVGGEFVVNKNSGNVRVQVVGHVVTLVFHVVVQLVKARAEMRWYLRSTYQVMGE